MNQPPPTPASSPSATGPRWKWPLVFAVLLVAAVGGYAGTRYWAFEWVRTLQLDPSPLPRPDVNAPYVQTPESVVDKMLELADLDADDVVYDLGCGDGRIVIAAAQRYGCRAVGYDINPERVAEARAGAQAAGVEELVTIEQQDVFKVDLTPASVVTIYLLPRMNKKLVPQLEKLKPGSRIICHDFGIEGYEPDQTVTVDVDHQNRHYLHCWTTPIMPAEPQRGSGQRPPPRS